jgi:hypothetical protein
VLAWLSAALGIAQLVSASAGAVSGSGAGAAGLAATFLAGLAADFLGAADFTAFFADFLAFLAVFLADPALVADFFAAFFADFFADLPADLFFTARSFLAFLAFFPRFFLPFAIVVLLLPLSPCLSNAQNRPHKPIGQFNAAAVRPLPNREAQSCAPQELTYRRQSAPCIRYCPQRSCPA